MVSEISTVNNYIVNSSTINASTSNTSAAKTLLRCENLSKTYQEGNLSTPVLYDVNFSMQEGELLAIVGSSGSGKSTLLHLLGGLDTPTVGDVIFKEKPLSQLSATEKSKLRNQSLGFIYQFHHLLPDFSALENVAMPLLIAGLAPKLAEQEAAKMLEQVGLAKRGKHRPSELSGGERQRVAIARALINKPALVLADEPTGNLDQRTTNEIFDLINTLNQQQKTAFLIVTHDLTLAARMSNQLEMRDGHLQTESWLLNANNQTSSYSLGK